MGEGGGGESGGGGVLFTPTTLPTYSVKRYSTTLSRGIDLKDCTVQYFTILHSWTDLVRIGNQTNCNVWNMYCTALFLAYGHRKFV